MNMASIETAAEQWSSLPNDLLRLVVARLASPEDDVVLPRVLIPSEAAGGCVIGAYDGGWVVSSQAPLGIVNLFSGDKKVVYSPEQKRIIPAQQQSTDNRLVLWKVVFSEVPTSGGCILAAITDKHGLALCKVDSPLGGWTTHGFTRYESLMDIAFCNGKLYGVYRYDVSIVKFEITLNEHGAPVVTAIHRLSIQYIPYYGGDPEENLRYIVELRGKLVIVLRYCCWPLHIRRPYFKVVELVDVVDGDRSATAYKYRWVEMTSLGDHALFLGPTCSKAVYVPEEVGRGGVKRNHVYYSHHRCLRGGDETPVGVKVRSLKSSTDDCDPLYYREDESVDGGVEKITYVEYFVKGGSCPPLWILPPNI